MSFSYKGVVGFKAKATLPSVDSWGTDMNILKDPPKSITTRRIDKVTDTSLITDMQDGSGDRACEVIKVYARGQDPFQKVMYNNVNTGRVNGFGGGVNQQASLPYKVNDNFRPPIRQPQTLIPLSRLPRTFTSQDSNPGFADYTRKMLIPNPEADKTAGIKKDATMIKTNIRPTQTYKLEVPVEHFTVKHVIQNPIQVSAHSGQRTLDYASQHVVKPVSHARNVLPVEFNVNVGSDATVQHHQNYNFNTDRYIQEDPLYSNVVSNAYHNINTTPIEMLNNTTIRTQNAIHTDYTTPIYGGEKQNYIHDDIRLTRNVPEHEARTNIHDSRTYIQQEPQYIPQLQLNKPNTFANTNQGGGQQSFDYANSRDYVLNPVIKAGGNLGAYDGKANMSAVQELQDRQLNTFESDKAKRNRKVWEMQMGGERFTR
jgi:hypothetical protein